MNVDISNLQSLAYVSDLSHSISTKKWDWTATVVPTVLTETQQPLSGATISVRWIHGSSVVNVSAVTSSTGKVTFSLSGLSLETVTFVVLGVTHPDYEFAPSLGLTQIVVGKNGSGTVSAAALGGGPNQTSQAAWALAADAALSEELEQDWALPTVPRRT